MARLWGRRVRSRAVGQMRAWRVCGAERIESGLWGGWEHALAVGQVMVDGGTARVRGGQAGDVAMGQAATHRRPRAQPALWHHSPCPNQRPHLPTLLGPLPPEHFQPIRSLGAVTSPVTRQVAGQRVPALDFACSSWAAPMGAPTLSSGGRWWLPGAPLCPTGDPFTPAGEDLARGGLDGTWLCCPLAPECGSGTATPTCLACPSTRGAPHLRLCTKY